MYKIGDKVYNDEVVNALPVFDPKTVAPVTVGDKVVTQADIESAVAMDPLSFDTLNCTGFANNNSAEIQIMQQTGVELNFSDRAMSVLAQFHN